MSLRDLLLSPVGIHIALLIACGVWVLRDEKDRSRQILFLALLVNLFYRVLFGAFMNTANGVLHWKYDYYLASLDRVLGVSTAAVALGLQGVWAAMLKSVYDAMLPATIAWLAFNRKTCTLIARGYVAQLTIGPMLYCLLPAAGPVYAFGNAWTHPPVVPAKLIQLAAAPVNAFPSLHVAAALFFVLTAKSRVWRGIALVFFVATGLATLTIGEHYVIDLVAGLAFGCFLLNFGKLRIGRATGYLAITVAWSLAIRFGVGALLAHPAVVQIFAVLTTAVAAHAVWAEWSDGTPVLDNGRILSPREASLPAAHSS